MRRTSAAWTTAAGDQPELADGVHVWRARLDGEGHPPTSRLTSEERRRADRLGSPGRRRRWLVSRWALRTVLGRYLQQDPAAVALSLGPNGKPALVERASGLRFNLSHSADLALVAVASEREVGVDVERIAPRRALLRLADRALEPADAAAVRAAPPPQRLLAFHRAWVRREAVVKCLGSGLRGPLPQWPVTASELDVGPGYAAALAVAGREMPEVCLFDLQVESHPGRDRSHCVAS